MDAARAMGITAVRFEGAQALRAALHLEGLPLKLTDDVLRDACMELSEEREGGE